MWRRKLNRAAVDREQRNKKSEHFESCGMSSLVDKSTEGNKCIRLGVTVQLGKKKLHPFFSIQKIKKN